MLDREEVRRRGTRGIDRLEPLLFQRVCRDGKRTTVNCLQIDVLDVRSRQVVHDSKLGNVSLKSCRMAFKLIILNFSFSLKDDAAL